MLWSPRVDPAVLFLEPTPLMLPAMRLAEIDDLSPTKRSPDGDHRLFGSRPDVAQVMLLPEVHPGTALAAVVILDAQALDRIEALTRFVQRWQRRSSSPDSRMTAQQRRRFRQMIQAADGWNSGASYREVATVLFGSERVRSEPWKTAALREVVIRLVAGGNALIDGGYLKLLRRRRRPSH